MLNIRYQEATIEGHVGLDPDRLPANIGIIQDSDVIDSNVNTSFGQGFYQSFTLRDSLGHIFHEATVDQSISNNNSIQDRL
jgi:hypothetical protein